ncbi:MAG: hypothetical protein NZ922_05620 [Candidatus Methanomethyliaceae archaeon]|nr:hypothetical protein [Candidatus Methanomethyliaceae archaeon]
MFRDLNLSEAEAKIYLTLINNSGNAKELSKRSNVPYTKIYGTLSSLERKGLIYSSNERPKIYYIKEGGLEEYRARMQKELYEKYEKIKQFLKKEGEKPSIWIMKNYDEILNKVHEMLLKSKNEIKIAIPGQLFLVEKIAPIIIAVRNRGVKVNILISESALSSIRCLSELASIRVGDMMFGGGIIVDNSEVMILVYASNGVTALWADHAGLVEMANAYFNFLWSKSKALI